MSRRHHHFMLYTLLAFGRTLSLLDLWEIAFHFYLHYCDFFRQRRLPPFLASISLLILLTTLGTECDR